MAGLCATAGGSRQGLTLSRQCQPQQGAAGLPPAPRNGCVSWGWVLPHIPHHTPTLSQMGDRAALEPHDMKLWPQFPPLGSDLGISLPKTQTFSRPSGPRRIPLPRIRSLRGQTLSRRPQGCWRPLARATGQQGRVTDRDLFLTLLKPHRLETTSQLGAHTPPLPSC